MSQIDKAFLSAYAKKRPVHPTSNEVQPLVDPAGERILKIHLSNGQALQPHVVAEAPRQPVPPAPEVAPAHATMPEPDGSKGNSVHISQSAARIASLSSIRRDAVVATPPKSIQSSPTTTGAPMKSIASSAEQPPRKTLTSYLQQARQSGAAPVLPTRWSPAKPSAPTPPPRPLASDPTRRTSLPSTQTNQSIRIDAPHAKNPPIERPSSTIPWAFGTVERSIKATADSSSISARTNNEAIPVESPSMETQRRTPPFGKSLSAESLAKISMPIQPVWEVDDFLWPNATANLLVTQSEAFHEIGLHLQHAQSKGLRVLSITSGERGVGRSTVAMCLAKTLAKLGLKIGLLDGDYECPSLVDQLNLETQHGWQQCLLDNIPLDEVAVHAVNDGITFFPLTDSMASSQVAVHAIRINKLIRRISNAYDMVIIDANRLTQKQSQLLGTGDEAVLDAALLIVDAELSMRQRVDAAVELVRQQGVQSIGLVENFHS